MCALLGTQMNAMGMCMKAATLSDGSDGWQQPYPTWAERASWGLMARLHGTANHSQHSKVGNGGDHTIAGDGLARCRGTVWALWGHVPAA